MNTRLPLSRRDQPQTLTELLARIIPLNPLFRGRIFQVPRDRFGMVQDRFRRADNQRGRVITQRAENLIPPCRQVTSAEQYKFMRREKRTKIIEMKQKFYLLDVRLEQIVRPRHPVEKINLLIEAIPQFLTRSHSGKRDRPALAEMFL